MSLEHMLRDEQEALRFLLGEEFDTMANFVKVGNDIVNLDTITMVEHTNSAGASSSLEAIRLHFVDGDYHTLYPTDPGYHEWQTWMDEQPTPLHD